FNGTTDLDLLLQSSPAPATNSLSVGEEQSIQLTIRVFDCDGTGPFENNATVEGRTAYDSVLVDESVNGTDPDLTPDSIPTNDMSPTPVNFDCLLVAQTEVSSVICFGDDDGIATASATG